MYIITAIICNIDANEITVKSEAALDEVLTVLKLIFTPINAMVLLASLGNVFGKVKDKVYGTDKAGKRVIIIIAVFILLIIFEKSYIGDFIRGLLG